MACTFPVACASSSKARAFFPSSCVDVGKVSHPCDAFPGKESGGIKNGASKKGEKECGNEIVTQYICQCIMYQRTNVLSHKQDVTCVSKRLFVNAFIFSQNFKLVSLLSLRSCPTFPHLGTVKSLLQRYPNPNLKFHG